MTDQGAGQHEFGAEHTLIKLDALSQYLTAYTIALKNTRFRLHYIDAFAGTGTCFVKVGDERVEVPGSASIAVNCTPPFHRLTFIEKSAKKVRALEKLMSAHLDKPIEIMRTDANTALPACLASLNPVADRAIAFLDPFGMQLKWETLRAIGASGIVDVWYLFPLFGLYRQAARDAAAIDAMKEAALDQMLGTHAWYAAFYGPKPQPSLFGGDTDERKADVSQMLAWVRNHLGTIFAEVAKPKVLYQTMPSGKQGAPMFALFFLVSNPASKARGLAMKIAGHILGD